jgi:hypothetical protein
VVIVEDVVMVDSKQKSLEYLWVMALNVPIMIPNVDVLYMRIDQNILVVPTIVNG